MCLWKFPVTVAAAALLLVAGEQANAADKDIVATAKAAGSFDTLCKAVQAAGLEETLQGKGPFTVFAPTDEAFAKIPKDKLDALMKDKAKLKEVLLYHVVKDEVMAAEVAKMETAKTAGGQMVKITAQDGKVMVNDSRVSKADIKASNGVIHVIDTVLMPSDK